MQASGVEEEIGQLIACGPLKAWSVIVTILGDLCHSRRDRITGRDLNALASRMGLTPPAVRVALHRLKRDGWIDTQRRGRDAAYGLSAMGWAEAQAVRDWIYAACPATQGPVHLLLVPPHLAATEIAAALPDGALMATPRCALLAGPLPPLPDGVWAAAIADGPPPGWVADAVAGAELRAGYARLAEAASGLAALRPQPEMADAIALRLLTLHHWRRLRLRHGDLPDLLLGEGWEGAAARRAVMAVLNRFPRPAPGDLAA